MQCIQPWKKQCALPSLIFMATSNRRRTREPVLYHKPGYRTTQSLRHSCLPLKPKLETMYTVLDTMTLHYTSKEIQKTNLNKIIKFSRGNDIIKNYSKLAVKNIVTLVQDKHHPSYVSNKNVSRE